MRVTDLAPTTSLSFVHTARRYYRLNDLVRLSDRTRRSRWPREDDQTVPFRGSKSRNKVSVGEPAEGSLPIIYYQKLWEKKERWLMMIRHRRRPLLRTLPVRCERGAKTIVASDEGPVRY